MKQLIISALVMTLAHGCSSPKTYENTVFPEGSSPWLPVNPEYFDKTEAQRIFEGNLIK